MYHVEQSTISRSVPLRPAQELIDDLRGQVSLEARLHLKRKIEAESRGVANAAVLAAVAKVEEAGADETLSRRRADDLGTRRRQAEEHLQGLPQGNWLRAYLLLGCALACFVAEFAFTHSTLPLLLNITGLVMGIFVAVAPTTAQLVLDMVFERLVERPWRQFRHMSASPRFYKPALALWLLIFLLGVAGLNGYMVWLLADARELVNRRLAQQERTDPAALLSALEAVKDKTAANAAGAEKKDVEPSREDAETRHLMRVISVTVLLDGALLLLLGFSEANRRSRHRRAHIAVDVLRAQHEATEKLQLQQAAQVNVCRRTLVEAEAHRQTLADEWQAQMLCYLAQKCTQLREARAAYLVVEDVLAGRAEADAWQAAAEPKAA